RSRPPGRRPRGAGWTGGLELDLRGGLAAGRGLEVRLLAEAAERRDHAPGEALERGVVVSHRLVEAHPLDGDAVLRPLELALEGQEVLVRLELGIALHGDEEPAQGPPELGLGVLELPERLGVIQDLGRDLEPGQARAGPGDL